MQKKSGVRRGICLILTAATVLGMTGCSGKGKTQENQTDVSEPIQVGILVSDDSYAYRETRENKEFLAGTEPEIIKELAVALGRQVSFKEAESREELLSLLNQGKIEIAAGRLCWMDSYSGSYIASGSYGKGGLYLVTRQYDYSDMVAGYENEPIGVSQSISESCLMKVKGLEKTVQTSYSDMETAVSDLTSGRLKAVLCTEREAVKMAESNPAVQIQELAFGPREEYHFLLLPGQETMASNISIIIGRYLDHQADGFPKDNPDEKSEVEEPGSDAQAKTQQDDRQSSVRG